MIARQDMLDGIAELERGNWQSARSHFDQAIRTRTATPWQNDPQSAWLLAAAWINRADALRFLGHPNEALTDLSQAIAAMRYVPIAENVLYLNRLILAWINRATILGEIGMPGEALAAFETAQSLFAAPLHPGQFLHSITLHTNRARLLLDEGFTLEGLKEAQYAIGILKEIEPAQAPAEASLKSRAILCRALALLLDSPKDRDLIDDWIALATDTVEEALLTAKESNYQGEFLGDLVRYGAKIYGVCQPNFLSEYLREWLSPDTHFARDPALLLDLHQETKNAIANLERHLRKNFPNPPIVISAIETLEYLKQAKREILQKYEIARQPANES
ncbi:tetratricopeptide repeat protein [Verrucomicrobiaceae bacterium 227]